MRQGLDCALSGQAALDKLDGCIGQQIILLVSDINMPGMSGIDLIPEVKARRPDLPVFMISAYGDAEADSRGALTTFLGGAINGMEDRDPSKIRMANRATVVVEVVKGGIDNDLEIPRECLHDPNPCRVSGSSAHCRPTIFAMASADAASSASGHRSFQKCLLQ